MTFRVLQDRDVSYLDKLLIDDVGNLRVMPSEELKTLVLEDLQIWGNKKGVYCFPTWELISWLRSMIGERSAIEICAGNGAIGRALGLISTDSYVQTTPEVMAMYRSIGQNPIHPPKDVKRFEALEAVEAYKPEVVFGSYITQKYQDGDSCPPVIGSSIFGVDELMLFSQVKMYICIGNETTHGNKRLLKEPHKKVSPNWLFTRSLTPEKNIIYIWEH